ncbi:hypothetical protein P7K49_024936 [Saguinus oedipus]|uniref:Uncharacterized protein n=1 Tax=Saguinus oedipus TaxID=9490 RepID=A0ABQ9UHZ5_SAGOE|nr:hypothetical protein P7K49_024936 [Saguinus oedipus]
MAGPHRAPSPGSQQRVGQGRPRGGQSWAGRPEAHGAGTQGGEQSHRMGCGVSRDFSRPRLLSSEHPGGQAGTGVPLAAQTASRRVPDCGRPVHSPLLPPQPEKRPVLRRAATLVSVANIVRVSHSISHGASGKLCEAPACATGGRPLTPQTPPPPGGAERSSTSLPPGQFLVRQSDRGHSD